MNRKAFDIALRTSAALAAMVMASVPCAAGADGTKVPDVWPLQKQIDEIAESGGGTLTLTAGVYRTGAIFFKPGVNLHLEKGATILGVDEAEGYPKRETRIEGRTRIHYPALVNAYHCDGFKISGEGVIDGHGAPTWEEFWSKYNALRKSKESFYHRNITSPRLLYVTHSTNADVARASFCK